MADIACAINLPKLLAHKSGFLLGPRQTGKSWIIRHTLRGARVYDLLNEVHRLIEQHGIRFLLTGSRARKLRGGGVN